MRKYCSNVCKLHSCLATESTNWAHMRTIVTAALQWQYLQTCFLDNPHKMWWNWFCWAYLYKETYFMRLGAAQDKGEERKIPSPENRFTCVKWWQVPQLPECMSQNYFKRIINWLEILTFPHLNSEWQSFKSQRGEHGHTSLNKSFFSRTLVIEFEQ